MSINESSSPSSEVDPKANRETSPLSLVRSDDPPKPTLPPRDRRDSSPLPPGPPGEELNARLLQPLVSYTSDHYGVETARRILHRNGLRPQDLTGKRYWISLEAFEAILAGCRSLFVDDEEFRAACRYRLGESYGPLSFLVRAASVGGTLALAARTMHLVSRISRYEILETNRGQIRTRYTSDKAESRLMCLSRVAQIEAFSTLWGLPRAAVEETGCIARGDSACTYDVRWYERPRWIPALAGVIAGGLGGAGLIALGGPALAGGLMLLAGGLVGHMVELGKVYRRNVAYSEENNETLRELARRNAEAVQEIIALNQRHRDWSRLLEAQITERQRQMEEAIERMGDLMNERHMKTTQVTHDISNSMVLLKTIGVCLAPHLPTGNQDAHAALEDVVMAAERVDRMVRSLLGAAVEPLGSTFPLKVE
ncbi:MAG: hypothetical protein RBU30_17820, partial [Polyangia bacterium]|nr:hypothetical protein [Polyangia bacterium]